LILTSTGDLSRNRQVGLMLAQGLSLPDILERLGHVAEGVPTTRATCQLARAKNIDMPIAEATLSILEGRVEAREVVPELLSRDPKPELDA
ncbi:MAG: glycerol-3-phosphate dehydrogenase, partial [Zoogloeaceae bacterium]|nr:glycerol-3-phosphate dehydrogenase [Zoogloeaceae bacterium]